jgi:serine/threonine protein kinase/Tol biopolymer transport system component
MTPERWRDVERVCQAALDRPPADRGAFLDGECAGDAELRREVESLLEHQAEAEGVLDTPPWEAAADAFSDGGGEYKARFEAGQRLGPFEIEALLGSGGMGEVYRARDLRLGRTVALKVLAPEAAADPDRRRRLELEARAASSLSHPHICALFDIRSDEGVDYLVMEHLEGETLADRMARAAPAAEGGPRAGLPLDEAIEWGAQIADALAAAHRCGIVHRDLKPGNVMLTRDGAVGHGSPRVKLLDFGLAKVRPPLAGMVVASAVGAAPPTAAGIVLGTVNYMAPEQLQGKEADPRTDLFAFGALLYEMVTGRRAFEGATPASVIVAILEREPQVPSDWQMVVPALERLIRACLTKDPEQRWDSARLAAQELRRIAADAADPAVRALPPPPRERPRRRAAWRAPTLVAATGIVALAVALTTWYAARAVPPSRPGTRLDLDLGMGFIAHPLSRAVLSPDGSAVAFVGDTQDGRQDTFIRRLDRPGATPLHTGGGWDLAFSPDGQWLAFAHEGKLRKVNVAGGPVMDLCSVTGETRGISWSEDGFIVGAFELSGGLSRLPSAGGTPVPVTTLDARRAEVTHRWPQVLPGGDAVLFTAHTFANHYDEATLDVVSLRDGRRKTVMTGGYYGRYLPSGHLVFVRHGALLAAPMDVATLQVTGPAVPVVDDVVVDADLGRLAFSFSNSGDALTLTGRWEPTPAVPAWRDQAGVSMPLPLPPDQYADPRVSPDGRRVVLTVGRADGARQMVVYERGRTEPYRLVSAAIDIGPVWAPDSEYLLFGSDEDRGIPNLYWRRADGAGRVERVTRNASTQIAGSFSPDGRRLAYAEFGTTTSMDGRVLPIDLRTPDRPVVGAPELIAPEVTDPPMFSPDGRWLAYSAPEGHRTEIFVTAAAAEARSGAGNRWQVSREGGADPLWSRDGRQLFFEARSGHLMVTRIAVRNGALVASPAERWAGWTLPRGEPRYVTRNFDLSPDGKRVLVLEPVPLQPASGSRPAVTLFQNFFDQLRRRAPAGR